MKQVVQLNDAGYFSGIVVADESPLEPGVYLLPAGAIDVPFPEIPAGKQAKWVGEWLFEEVQQQAIVDITYSQRRAAEYPPITDYLDGVVKGDQAQIDAYIAACQAVKAKYPKPESV